jgi:hypothetical protein
LETTVNPLAPLASTLLIASPFVTLGYLGLCLVWPFKACRRCRGHGQFHGLFGGIRLCGHCDGTGLRLRLGRRAWNAFRRLYRDINSHD